MDEEIIKYIKWRYKMNNHNKYMKYFDEWFSGITDNQLMYFKLEKERLIKSEQYQ